MRAASTRGLRATHRMVAAGGVAVVLVALACSRGAAPAADSAAEADAGSAVVTLPGRQEFVDGGLALEAEDRTGLQAELGAPDSTAAEVIPNRHVPGVMDTIYTLHYPDLVARVHRPGGGGDLMSRVEVRSNRYLRYPVLGSSVQQIEAAFGPPDEATDSSLTYYCTSCIAGDDPVEIVFEDGEARRVRFDYYVD